LVARTGHGEETPPPAATPQPQPPPPPSMPPPAPPLTGYSEGFFLQTADGRFSLHFNGFAQLLYVGTYANGTFNNTFDLALGRLALSGTVFSTKLHYFFQFEGSTFGDSNGISMLDWAMKYSFAPWLRVTAGRTILAYSRQFYTHPGNLLFADLSAADYAFNLPRAVGVQAGGAVSRLSYDIFITNSVRSLGVGTQLNRGDTIAAGLRLNVDILKPYGYIETIPSADHAPELSLGVAFAYNPIADTSSFQNDIRGDDTVNTTVDVGFRWTRLSIQSAFYWRRKTNREGGDNYGYYAQAGAYVIKERFELAARASGVYFAAPETSMLGGPLLVPDRQLSEYSFGANLYLFGHGAKLQTDYSFLWHDPFVGNTFGSHRWRVQLQILF
jgi:hypothetical protein